MDEILSSIKRIIADEDRAKAPAPKKAKASANIEVDTAQHGIEDDVAGEEILELTETALECDPEDDLLDDNKAQSLRHSFSALQTLAEPGVAPQIVRSGETSLEGLAREMLKPMLKNWLDTNLPSIVESMVSREINRITKKG